MSYATARTAAIYGLLREAANAPVTVRSIRAIAILLVTAATGAAAMSSNASTGDPCAKQEAAVRRARSGLARRTAKRALELCRYRHAVSIVPANPLASETITATIHPRWPLRRGCRYVVVVLDTKGHPGDGFVHSAEKRTTSLTVQIGPADRIDPGEAAVGAEWAPGEAELFVIEGTLRQLAELPEPWNPKWHPKTREVGGLGFRFLPRPGT
jgi:hypothetical protein